MNTKRLVTIMLLVSLMLQLMPMAATPLAAQASLPDKGQVSATMYKVNQYWIQGHPDPGDTSWNRAVYFMGDLAHYQMTQDVRYINYLDGWLRQNDWRLNSCTSNNDNTWTVSVDADAQAAAQLILDSYKRNSFDWVIGCPKATLDQSMVWAKLDLDLGHEVSLNRIKLSPYNNRAYRYYIDAATSLEGPYTNIVNRSANASPTAIFEDTFPATTVRYLRLIVIGATGYGGKDSENWVSVSEMELFGDASPNPIPVPISNDWPKCSASTQAESPCKNAVDGNLATRWSASFPLSAQVTGVHDSMNWWWIDATFMAMPLYAQMAAIENNPRYSEVMNVRYQYAKSERGTDTVRGLYDPTYGLWYRDSGFISPPASIGLTKPIFWSRGNGWVFAALARTLQILPPSDPHYAEYLADFKAMAAKVVAAQQPEGYWTSNLLHRADFPGGDSSGTSLFTFGLAWGLNSGQLQGDAYRNAVIRGWNWLSNSAVRSDGFLQFVQGAGFQPGPAPADSTADFGVGVFLLAGSEVYKLAPNAGMISSAIVNSTEDPGDGICDAKQCTLREAIATLAPGGTIDFKLTLPATINLQAGQLVINKPMTISGPGREKLTVNGRQNDVVIYRVLYTSGSGIFVQGMTLSNGMTGEPGGGLYNTGELRLKNVALLNNWSIPQPSGEGGGIYNAGSGVLYLDDVIVQDNHAYHSGAGILNIDDASIYMQNTTLAKNQMDLSAFGGGISNFSRGKVWAQIAPNGDWLPGMTQIIGNDAGGGAGIDNHGEMRMVHTLLQHNTSFSGYVSSINTGFLSLIESTITGNGTGEGYGGALANSGTLEFIRSLMYGNGAEKGTGGLTNNGNATILNSTISQHYTNRDMGVIHNGGVMTITNSTISDGRLSLSGGDGYGIYNFGTLTLGNSVLVNSIANCRGPIISLGGNLSSDGSCALSGTGDQNNVDPKLDVLKDNGGPTLTQALLPGSPAIDAGNNTQCPATDQRNETRPKDGNGDGNAICDIGAYEASAPPTNKATIVIRKDTQPDSMQDFAYYGPFGKFYLDDAQPDDGDAVKNSMSYTVNPGTYNFAEGVFQSWHLADIVCVGGGQSSNNLLMHSVSITVKAGDQMLCTFVTQRRVDLEATIYNDLNANRARDAGEPPLSGWEFRFYQSDGSLINHKVTDANGSAKQSNVIPGSFKICETPKAGWNTTSYGWIDPVLGVPCYPITLPPGQSIQVVFGVTQASVVLNSEEVDSTSGAITGTLPDINEPESEEPFEPEVNQRVYLPLMNR